VLDDEIGACTTRWAAHELKDDVLAARRAQAAVAVSRTLGRERAETRRWRVAVAHGRDDVGRHGATADDGRAVLDDEISARTTRSAAHELKDDVLAARRALLAAVAVSRPLGRARAETRRWRPAVAQRRGDVGRHGATADNGRAVLDDEIGARSTRSAAHELKDDVLAARLTLRNEPRRTPTFSPSPSLLFRARDGPIR